MNWSSERWLHGEELQKHFESSISYPSLPWIQSTLFPRKHLGRLVEKSLKLWAESRQLDLYYFNHPVEHPLIQDYIFSGAGLTTAHSDHDVVISGSADGFENPRLIRFLSLIELLERLSYQIGKRNSLFKHFVQGIHLDSWSELDFLPLSTTGMAVHRTPTSAVTRGLLEALERDAYLCHWYTRTRPTPVRLQDNPRFAEHVREARSRGLRFGMFQLKSAHPDVKVVLLVTVDPDSKNGTLQFSTGLAADFSVESAFKKASLELNRFVSLSSRHNGQALTAPPPLTEPMGRYYYYQAPEHFDALSVFIPDESDDAIDLTICKSEGVRSKGPHPLLRAFPNTRVYPAPIPKDLRHFLYAVMVHIPELQPLDYETEPVINQSRLKEFSRDFIQTPLIPIHPLP